ncbi:unnamed protein product, partial [Oppiella nova]
MVKSLVRSEHPFINSEDQLWEAVQVAYERMCGSDWRQFYINLLESVPKRMDEVIDTAGGYTRFWNGSPGETIHSVRISWTNIRVSTKTQKSMYNCFQTKKMPKEIIRNVNAGSLLAIMGASGSGKTTLLNVLTARNLRQLSVNGVVLMNGQAVSQQTIASMSSYIQQHDLFQPMLTVREHLMFQVLLRMDRNLSNNEKQDCIQRVIDKFNLAKCAETRIGDNNHFKGISGG